MKPHVRGVILEGLSTAGKTSVLRSIKISQAKHQDSERSVLVLGEHYSQQLQNIHGKLVNLTKDQHLSLLNDRVEGIEKLNEWAIHLGPASRRSRGLFFVLERFHLNHRFTYGDSENIATLERRISEVGGICFLLTASPECVRERILLRERTEQQETIDQTCDMWLSDQERLIMLSRESGITTTIIETDGQEWDKYASQIIDALDNST